MNLTTYLLFFLAFGCVGVARGQDQQQNAGFLEGLITFFQSNGHSQLANTITQINGTNRGQALLASFQGQNLTIFAPVDEAFQTQTTQGNGTIESLVDIVSYHILLGDFTNTTSPNIGQSIEGTNATTSDLLSGVYPNATLGRTFLNDTDYVALEGNKSQVLAWTRNQSTEPIYILNQPFGNVTVQNSTRYYNLLINSIPSILSPPPPLPQALTHANLSIISYIISMVPAPPSYFLNSTNSTTTLYDTFNTTTGPDTITTGSNASLLDALSAAGNTSLTTQPGGYTIFAPDDPAIRRSMSGLDGYLNNSTSILALVYNHMINGTTVYSTEFGALNNTDTNSAESTPTPQEAWPKPAGATSPSSSSSSSSSSSNPNRDQNQDQQTPYYYTAAGEAILAWTNASGTFITTQNARGVPAKIVRSDVLVNNGVIHILDGVLVNLNEDREVASSAYASETSFAAVSTTQSGPIGLVPGFTTTSTEASGATSSVEASTSGAPGTSGSSGGTENPTSTESVSVQVSTAVVTVQATG